MIKRLLLGTGLAIVLLLTLVLGVVWGQTTEGDEDNLLTRLQPMLVSIQQSVPLSLTLTVPTSPTETMTVTVPAVVDVNVAVRIADTLTPTVVITPSTAALVDVSTLVPTPTPEPADTDDSGNETIDVVDWSWSRDSLDMFIYVSGLIENISDETVCNVKISAAFLDADKKLRTTDTGYADTTCLEPGSESTFKIMVSNDDTIEYVRLVNVQWRNE